MAVAPPLYHQIKTNKVMSNVKNKVILVTGASRGIGAVVAKTLARNGAMVVVNYAGSRPAAEQVVADIAALVGVVDGVGNDLADQV